MNNQDVRKSIVSKGLRYWQVADMYGITDSNFSRLLRKELPKGKKDMVLKAISEAEQKYLVR